MICAYPGAIMPRSVPDRYLLGPGAQELHWVFAEVAAIRAVPSVAPPTGTCPARRSSRGRLENMPTTSVRRLID